MKKTKVSLGHGLPVMSLKGLERLVMELKSLRKRRIRQDPRTISLLDNGEVKERVIYVRIPEYPGRVFEYVVREYGDIGFRHTFLSINKYTSSDLRKRKG
ncbi:MAG: hypothetical protein AABX50_00755 [Nanoarchaeota archaeon]